MNKYHMSPDGNLRICRSQNNCRFGGSDAHIQADDLKEAYRAFENKLENNETTKTFTALSKKNEQPVEEEITQAEEAKKAEEDRYANQLLAVDTSSIISDLDFDASYLRDKICPKDLLNIAEELEEDIINKNTDNMEVKLDLLAEKSIKRVASNDVKEELKKHSKARLFETYEKRVEAIKKALQTEVDRDRVITDNLAKLSELRVELGEKDYEKMSHEEIKDYTLRTFKILGEVEGACLENYNLKDKENGSSVKGMNSSYSILQDRINYRAFTFNTKKEDLKEIEKVYKDSKEVGKEKVRVARGVTPPVENKNENNSILSSKNTTTNVELEDRKENARRIKESLPKLPLNRAFEEWNSNRLETRTRKVKVSQPVKGIRGWMGAEETIIKESKVPTPEAMAVIEWQNNLSPETKQIFDVYFEAKTAGASENVLKEIENSYEAAKNKESLRNTKEKEQLQKAKDDYYLAKLKSSRDSSLTI